MLYVFGEWETCRLQFCTCPSAVLVQAEALYGMGEFERSLVLFHRGARKRPDLVTFTRGIHKAREAIINAIGGEATLYFLLSVDSLQVRP